MDEKTYDQIYTCRNCGVTFRSKIPFGTPRPSAVHCHHCGCMTDGTLPKAEPETSLKKYVVNMGRSQFCAVTVTATDHLAARRIARETPWPTDDNWCSGDDWIESVRELEDPS